MTVLRQSQEVMKNMGEFRKSFPTDGKKKAFSAYLRHDLTPAQLDESKRLKQQCNQFNEQNSDHTVQYYVYRGEIKKRLRKGVQLQSS